MKLALNGCLGKMGRRIADIATQAGHFIVAPIEQISYGKPYMDLTGIAVKAEVIGQYKGGADVLIDFSMPDGFSARMAECVKHGTPFVSGTTGLTDRELKERDAAAKKIPVLSASNMSLGVNLLLNLVRQAAQKLGPGYDIEIVEMHH